MDKQLLVILVVIIAVVGALVIGAYFFVHNPMAPYIDELEELGFTVNIGSDNWELSRENYPEIDVHYQHEDWDNFIEWALVANYFYEVIQSDFVIWADAEDNVLFLYIPSFQSSDINLDEIVVYHNP